ncbi:MAG TPA: thiamine pyrophosphate-binding protein [Ferruginibacter sp.]|nr:thiamine pyrophosphate-binding protein [Ferruginibacter sp.]
MKVSDKIAAFLEEHNIGHVFGIVGAGNVHIFNSIQERGFTQIICVHNEQAATMAMQTYYRVNGIVTAAILTTGAGSTNGVTGVVSAWADSIPGVVISGNEHSKYIEKDALELRMYGVQGYDSSDMIKKVVKYNSRVMDPQNTIYELEKAFSIAVDGRPGPCWIDIPMNIQSANIDEGTFKEYKKDTTDKACSEDEIKNVVTLLSSAKRPVLWLGHGIRLGHAQHLVKELVETLNIPTLVTWAGIDMIDSEHPLIYGRAGVYGQRAANFVLQNCDLLICVGTRLAIPQVGYDINEFVRAAKIVVVDIDKDELKKYPGRYTPICADAKDFINKIISKYSSDKNKKDISEWRLICDGYRNRYPIVNSKDHPDVDGFINSYPFLNKLSALLRPSDIVVTDMGTALLSGHQAMNFKEGQRLITSTGLGEMGYGLPGAIGASFARNKAEVICLNCDGGMMLNLQELQTIVHHHLPIKIFVFNNDGYLMIKHTQKAMFKGVYSGTDNKSGVSCPDYTKVAHAFNLAAFQIRTWEDFDKIIPQVLDHNGPLICEVFMHPEQMFFPKLAVAVQKDGTLVSPPLEDLSPLLSRDELKENMIIGIHEKSAML